MVRARFDVGAAEPAADAGGSYAAPTGDTLDSRTAQVAELLSGPLANRREDALPAPSRKQGEQGDLADALADALGVGRESGGDAEAGAGDETAGLALDALAERLGISVEDVYAQVRVALPDGGGELSLGELKDLAVEHRKTAADRLEWETARETERAAMGQATAELQTLLGMIPAEARSPAMIRAAQEKLEVVRAAEQQKLLARVPSWRDPAQFQADLEVIGPHIEGFGFSKDEFGGVYDARLLAYIRHNALREQRLSAMLEQVRAGRDKRGAPRTTASTRPNSEAVRIPAGARASERVDAVAKLLRDMK